MRIFLVGFMGCGKTSIGKKLAKKLNHSFIDTDVLIEKHFNKTISQIFDDYGEEEFRNIEHQILLNTIKFDNCIISTGGGLPCFNENMDIINNNGLSIFISRPTKMIASRLSQRPDKRPLLKNLKNFEEIYSFVENLLPARIKTYQQSMITFYSESETLDNLIKKINNWNESKVNSIP